MLADRFDPRYFDRDVLFRWHAGWAGGTFSRASSAWYIDRYGILREAGPNVPRVEWLDLDGDGRRETAAALLEGARTNLVPWSDALSNWTKGGTPIVTDGAVTLGNLSLARVQDDSGSVTEYVVQPVVFTGDGPKAWSCYVRRGSTPAPSGSVLRLRDTTAGADRLAATLTWSGGEPTVSVAAGTLLSTEALGSGVYRLCFRTAAVTAANANRIEIYPAWVGSETGDLYAGGVQAEDATVPSSRIRTTGAPATRATDALYTDLPGSVATPTPLALYARWIEAGSAYVSGAVIAAIGTSAPSVRITSDGAGKYYVLWNAGDGAGNRESRPTPTVQLGDVVECLAILSPTGTITGVVAVNGGAPTTGPTSQASPLASSWDVARLHVGSRSSAGLNAGMVSISDALILRGSDWTLDEVRRMLP